MSVWAYRGYNGARNWNNNNSNNYNNNIGWRPALSYTYDCQGYGFDSVTY